MSSNSLHGLFEHYLSAARNPPGRSCLASLYIRELIIHKQKEVQNLSQPHFLCFIFGFAFLNLKSDLDFNKLNMQMAVVFEIKSLTQIRYKDNVRKSMSFVFEMHDPSKRKEP